jgi:hypothetical protein
VIRTTECNPFHKHSALLGESFPYAIEGITETENRVELAPEEIVAIVLFTVDGCCGNEDLREEEDMEEERQRGGSPSRSHG